jgi:Bacterial extracellular solute-binding protein
MFHRFGFLAFIATICLGPVATCGAAEIKVLNANALTIAMTEIVADFTKETGHQVSFVGVSPGQVEQRIRAGEVYDLVITATASAAAFEQEGRLRPGNPSRTGPRRYRYCGAQRHQARPFVSRRDPQSPARCQGDHVQRFEHWRTERRQCAEGARESRPYRCPQGENQALHRLGGGPSADRQRRDRPRPLQSQRNTPRAGRRAGRVGAVLRAGLSPSPDLLPRRLSRR